MRKKVKLVIFFSNVYSPVLAMFSLGASKLKDNEYAIQRVKQYLEQERSLTSNLDLGNYQIKGVDEFHTVVQDAKSVETPPSGSVTLWCDQTGNLNLRNPAGVDKPVASGPTNNFTLNKTDVALIPPPSSSQAIIAASSTYDNLYLVTNALTAPVGQQTILTPSSDGVSEGLSSPAPTSLKLHYATSSTPGIISTASQTIGGTKSLSAASITSLSCSTLSLGSASSPLTFSASQTAFPRTLTIDDLPQNSKLITDWVEQNIRATKTVYADYSGYDTQENQAALRVQIGQFNTLASTLIGTDYSVNSETNKSITAISTNFRVAPIKQRCSSATYVIPRVFYYSGSFVEVTAPYVIPPTCSYFIIVTPNSYHEVLFRMTTPAVARWTSIATWSGGAYLGGIEWSLDGSKSLTQSGTMAFHHSHVSKGASGGVPDGYQMIFYRPAAQTGNLTINYIGLIEDINQKTYSWDDQGALAVASLSAGNTSNQIVLGASSSSTTLTAITPAASRTVTIPDAGENSEFLLTSGEQTIKSLKNDIRDWKSKTTYEGAVASRYILDTKGATAPGKDAIQIQNLTDSTEAINTLRCHRNTAPIYQSTGTLVVPSSIRVYTDGGSGDGTYTSFPSSYPIVITAGNEITVEVTYTAPYREVLVRLDQGSAYPLGMEVWTGSQWVYPSFEQDSTRGLTRSGWLSLDWPVDYTGELGGGWRVKWRRVGSGSLTISYVGIIPDSARLVYGWTKDADLTINSSVMRKTTNQIVLGAPSNATTLSTSVPAGPITLNFPNTNGTLGLAPVDGSFVSTASGIWGVTTYQRTILTRTSGIYTTVTLKTVSGAASVSNTISLSGVIPGPAEAMDIVIAITNNSIITNGLLNITTGGVMTVKLSTGAPFTASGTGGFFGMTFTYVNNTA